MSRRTDTGAPAARPRTLTISRRGLMGTVAAGALIGLATPSIVRAQAKRFEGRRMTYVSWGGAYQDGQKKAYCDTFTELTGCIVDQDGPMENAKLRVMVQSGRPVWDVADVGAAFMYSGMQQGLFEKLDFGVIDKTRIDPRYVNDYGVGNIVFSYNVAHNTQSFAGRPTPKTWADLWDLKAFPGKRMLYSRPTPVLEMALLADGVDPAKLYPLAIDRAFRKLDQIKDHVLWWETNSQSQQLLASGAASCGLINNGRVHDAAQKGAPVAMTWDQNLQSCDYLVIPKGSKNLEIATAFIDHVANAEPQARFANLMPFSPTNPAAFKKIDAAMSPWLATNPDYVGRGVVLNQEFWQDKLEPVTARFNKWRLV